MCVLKVNDKGMVQEFVPATVEPSPGWETLDRRVGTTRTNGAIKQGCRKQMTCKA